MVAKVPEVMDNVDMTYWISLDATLRAGMMFDDDVFILWTAGLVKGPPGKPHTQLRDSDVTYLKAALRQSGFSLFSSY